MPYCPFCGSETADGDTFCRSCGAVLSGSVPGPKGPDNTRKMKYIAVALVGLILLTAVGGIVAAFAWDLLTKENVDNTYRWDYEGKSFSYELKVDSKYYTEVRTSDIDRTGSISIERYTTDSGTTLAVKDYIVVDKYIQGLSDSLKTMYKEAFGSEPTKEEYVKFASVFVNVCIKYDDDEYKGGYEYWRYPLETLCDRTGDCEDTSILLAAILDAAGYDSGIILLPGHAMCAVTADGIPDSPLYPTKKSSTAYSPAVEFYPVETTGIINKNIIGYINDSYEDVYMHLYLGHVTEYFSS